MESPRPDPSQILLLGASGHLGQGIARGLLAAGFEVHGLARGPSPAVRALRGVRWHFGDLRQMSATAAWNDLAASKLAIVNAAGVLQDGARDDLAATHVSALAALCAAARPGTLVVQISAPGVSPAASTAFYRTKAAGDAAVRDSGLPWVILRPAVVVSAEAYGGTALLRALAAFPGFVPLTDGTSPMRTVGLDDVVTAVAEAVSGRLPPGTDAVLGESRARSLADVVLLFRAWLGLPAARVVTMPRLLARAVSAVADAAGLLGWRSPLRSTALTVAAEGVAETPAIPCRALEEVLTAMPATVQERWFARLYLLKAPAILMLGLFWIISGVIGLLRWPEAAAVLTQAGFGAGAAALCVTGGAIADLVLGGLVLARRTSAMALLGMVALTAVYLGAASLFTPQLWMDPLGPLVKSLPAAMLALLTLAIDPER